MAEGNGAEQLAVRESAAKVKVANDNIEKNKQLINGITERYKTFFVAHFGIPPIDGIYKQYYENKGKARRSRNALLSHKKSWNLLTRLQVSTGLPKKP